MVTFQPKFPLAQVVSELLVRGIHPVDTNHVVAGLRGRTFTESGYSLTIDRDGYKDPKFCLKDLDAVTGTFQVGWVVFVIKVRLYRECFFL